MDIIPGFKSDEEGTVILFRNENLEVVRENECLKCTIRHIWIEVGCDGPQNTLVFYVKNIHFFEEYGDLKIAYYFYCILLYYRLVHITRNMYFKNLTHYIYVNKKSKILFKYFSIYLTFLC